MRLRVPFACTRALRLRMRLRGCAAPAAWRAAAASSLFKATLVYRVWYDARERCVLHYSLPLPRCCRSLRVRWGLTAHHPIAYMVCFVDFATNWYAICTRDARQWNGARNSCLLYALPAPAPATVHSFWWRLVPLHHIRFPLILKTGRHSGRHGVTTRFDKTERRTARNTRGGTRTLAFAGCA